MSAFNFRIPGRSSVEGLQSELSHLVDRWWHCGVNTGPLDGQDWAPALDLVEETASYRVNMELPGVVQSTLDVSLVANTLVICGEKPAVVLETGRLLHTERRYGGFKRSVELPGPIQKEGVTASFVDGVLSVVVPKVPGSGPIEIRVPVESPPPQG